ncbi:hypothetical protein LAZ67_18002218 [Cordylochernes scorpioides]|uniref:Uncharacterized protein n=1 Tax=Cordylochernes scorpioides TaxID=51811 RepID=A0ABY6LGE3_9ARAC|nr:hypothetical protein LAZ67_18002218 [Cordylochernes scorpioides]
MKTFAAIFVLVLVAMAMPSDAALCTAKLVMHQVLWYGAVLEITLALTLVPIASTSSSQRYIYEVFECNDSLRLMTPWISTHTASLSPLVLYRFTTGRKHKWNSYTSGSAESNSLQVRHMSNGLRHHRA